MKNLASIVLFFAIPFGIFAQTDYEKAVSAALADFDSSKTTDDMKTAAAKFERIAMAETSQWIPNYYVALINCILSFQTQDIAQIKLYTDNAQKFVDAAIKIAPEESEVHTLQGMVYQAIISIDPMNYGMTYGGKANSCFETAKTLNPANPRPYYLQAISLLYTPEQYGGGKKAAIGLFTQANELFASFVPASEISPDWGKEDCEVRLAECNKN